jgi:BirA family biotin operon repressor/biotin-[acetyl-CoA-carboxylase] ligase
LLPPSSPLPPDLREPLIRLAGRLGEFGARVVWYPEIPSTNDVAARLADAGADEGTVVAADAQSAGRGRLGRVWVSPAGAGVYVSIVLRPEASTGLRAGVKWPNDLFVDGHDGPAGGRKVAGILAERGAARDGSPWVVLGFGINILPAAYPPDVAARATSLESELGRAVDRGLVLAECLAALSVRYADLRAGRTGEVVSAWRARAVSTFGRRVEWDGDGIARRGTAHDVDDEGALLVRTSDGVVRVTSGEVRWI